MAFICEGNCGNGIVESGEECDSGRSDDPCCSDTCKRKAELLACLLPATFAPDGCEEPDRVGLCDSGVCKAKVKRFRTQCRLGSDACDEGARCDGLTGACPPSTPSDPTVVCFLPKTDCDALVQCDGVHLDCPRDGTNGACTVDIPDQVPAEAGADITCTAPLAKIGEGGSRCSAVGNEDAGSDALRGRNPRRLAGKRHAKLKKADDARRVTLRLRLNKRGKLLLADHPDGLTIHVVVTVRHGDGEVPVNKLVKFLQSR
jgi:hypothetical protein